MIFPVSGRPVRALEGFADFLCQRPVIDVFMFERRRVFAGKRVQFLRDGADGVLRQPLFLGPVRARILRQGFVRIERPSGRNPR